MNKTQLKYGKLCRPKHQVLIMVLFVVSLVATGLGGQALAPASASHTTVDRVPRVGSYTNSDPDIRFGWSKHGHNCGSWGCGDDFWVTSTKGVTAEWYLPDIQGVFTFSWNLGKNFRIDNKNGHPATGTVEWTIWERRVDSRSYELVHTFYPSSQRDRLGWWTYSDVRIELDGAVKIIAKAKEHGKRIGVKDVRLDHIDVLPELKEAAIELCKAGVVKALNITATVPSALAAAVVVVYAAPHLSSGVGGIAGAKLLTPKALGLLIPAILPDGPATAKEWVEGVIEDWVIDLISGFLSGVWDKLNEFYTKAVESYQHGCRHFKAPLYYFGITLGYGNYADDLAETYGRRRSSTTTPADTNDGEPRITLEWVSDTYTFDEDATNPAVKLRATAGGTKKPVRDLVITVRTRPGTALPAEDFIPFTDSVTFTAADFRLDDGGWALTAEVGVELLADDRLEVPESFSLAIDAASVPEHARVDAASATAEIVITDTSGPATLGVSEPSPTVVEGSLLTLCVEHDWWVEFPFLVTFVVDTANSADLPDPATWNVDYWTLEQQTVTFDVLEPRKCIEMPAAWDGLAEGSEQLTVSFSSSDARVVVPDPVTATIVDGEPTWYQLGWGPEPGTINEAGASYLYSCGGMFVAAGVTLEFDLTVGGTATVGRDYTIAHADGRELSAPYTLKCGDQGGFEEDGDIVVTSVDDTDVEGDETVELTASYKGTVIGTVTITIDDDDASGG